MRSAVGVETVVVGRIRRPHGIGGEVLVEPLTDVEGRFVPGAIVGLVFGTGDRRPAEIASVRPHRELLLVRFHGVESRDSAADLRGVTITVTPDEVPEPPDGSYYYFQLLGCRCRDVEAGSLGVVTDVVEDGGGLLLSLDLGGRILLVPFVRAYIRKIDLEMRAIDLDLPRGLLDLCVSPS